MNYLKVKNLGGVLIIFLCLSAYYGKAECVYKKAIYGEDLQIGTMLHWSTSMEDSNQMFVIEKSTDGVDFAEIGTVKGAGDSEGLKQYNFLDLMAKKEIAFYRLKQVDYDGGKNFSDILRVNKTYSNNFMVVRMSSTAVKETFNVTIDAFQDGKLEYNVRDWKGNMVAREQMELFSGLNELSLDMKNMQATVYKLEMMMDDEVETLTFRRVKTEKEKKTNTASTKKLGQD